jgi:hypothetical protein
MQLIEASAFKKKKRSCIIIQLMLQIKPWIPSWSAAVPEGHAAGQPGPRIAHPSAAANPPPPQPLGPGRSDSQPNMGRGPGTVRQVQAAYQPILQAPDGLVALGGAAIGRRHVYLQRAQRSPGGAGLGARRRLALRNVRSKTTLATQVGVDVSLVVLMLVFVITLMAVTLDQILPYLIACACGCAQPLQLRLAVVARHFGCVQLSLQLTKLPCARFLRNSATATHPTHLIVGVLGLQRRQLLLADLQARFERRRLSPRGSQVAGRRFLNSVSQQAHYAANAALGRLHAPAAGAGDGAPRRRLRPGPVGC